MPIFARPLDVPLCREALIEASRHRGGSMNLVVPAGIGRTVFLKRCDDLPDSVLEHALASLAACVPGAS